MSGFACERSDATRWDSGSTSASRSALGHSRSGASSPGATLGLRNSACASWTSPRKRVPGSRAWCGCWPPRARRPERARAPARRREDPPEDRHRARRTPRDRDIDRNHLGHASETGIALAEDPTARTTVPDRHHQLRVRRGGVRATERLLHVHRDRASHQQEIRMSRTGNEADPRSLEVVVRVVQRVDLQLAPVAGTGVDVANAERTAEHGQAADLEAHPRQPARPAPGAARSGSRCERCVSGIQHRSPHPSCPL